MIFAAFSTSRTLTAELGSSLLRNACRRRERQRTEIREEERERKREEGREDRRPWGQKKGEREFVLYIVFKEAHLFWQEELSLTNIQTIFTIQELKNRTITILYLRRERGREGDKERERRGKRSRKKKEDKRMKRPVIHK